MKKAVKWGIVGASTLGVLYSWYCVVPSFYQKWVSRKAIRRIPRPEGKEIVLTFDDGPDPRYTPKVLDVLKKYGISAHFFVVAERAKENPDLIRRMLEEGHEVGLHAYAHKNAWLVTPGYVKRDFAKSCHFTRTWRRLQVLPAAMGICESGNTETDSGGGISIGDVECHGAGLETQSDLPRDREAAIGKSSRGINHLPSRRRRCAGSTEENHRCAGLGAAIISENWVSVCFA